ncbi:DUF4214 domain-containing protein [Methylobacterium sp. CB376]|uniref:DUF4214 domain-containing protein n=1 Tax=unclassified Methylobacterium TaxID=2615210 RepID=UPI0012370E00|nr:MULTISPECIES: DUF4214 domain-containing protein [Methylobacterium]WFT79578.1 DUF4214 domain-containing protein [Methylobacterium nodulans]
MDYNEAQKIACELYGRVLLRDADQEGFAYTIDRLTNNIHPLEIAREMMLSEEFADKFLLNTSINEIARKIHVAAFGSHPTKESIKQNAMTIVAKGFQGFISDIIARKIRNSNSRIPDLREY